MQAECVEDSCDTLHSGTESASLMEPRESSTLSAKSEEERLCVQVAELLGEVDKSKDEANLELLKQTKVEVEALQAINKVILKLPYFILSVSSGYMRPFVIDV